MADTDIAAQRRVTTDEITMKKYNKFNLLILSPSGAFNRQINFSKWTAATLLLLSAAGMLLAGWLATDYIRLKNESTYYARMIRKVDIQDELISTKQKQIELLANKVDVLKSHFVGLKKLETKVKVLANLQDETDQGNLFSIGGSVADEFENLNDQDQNLSEVTRNTLVRELNNDVETLYLASINQKRSLEDLLDDLRERANLLACTPSIRPTAGWISSSFGYRESPFTHNREFHKGLDIAGHAGTEIFASADGVVTYCGRKGSFGRTVMIDHGYGMVTKYAHTKKILVNRGEYVKRGDVIALMGNSGRSTGPHLHYEVLLNGVHVNPLNYIQN